MLSSPAMRFVLSLLKLSLFAFALTFAIKNTDPVPVRYFLGNEWHAPLIFIMLAFLCFGAILGLLSALGQILRQRREIVSLKRELDERSGIKRPSAPRVATRS